MRSRSLNDYQFAAALRMITVATALSSAPAWTQPAVPRAQVAASTAVTKPVPALLPLSVQFDVTSINTGRTYRIYLSTPVAPAPAAGYPVLYVLDGDTSYPTAASQAVLASLLGEQKPVLVVGVAYPDVLATVNLRWRDLTPYSRDAENDKNVPQETGQWGGGDAFHKFMVEELRPIVESMAKIDKSEQSLMGYSLGGLFTLHVLLTNPETYKNYVIGSPSIWLSGKRVLQEIPSFTKKVQAGIVSPRVLITADELEQLPASSPIVDTNRMIDNAREVANTLRRIKGTNGYRVDYALFDKETHNSGIPASTSRGVAFVGSVLDGSKR